MHDVVHTDSRKRWLLAVAAGAALSVASASLAGTADGGRIERRAMPPAPSVLRESAERTRIAQWAREHQLTGLSPETLASVSTRPAPLQPGPR